MPSHHVVEKLLPMSVGNPVPLIRLMRNQTENDMTLPVPSPEYIGTYPRLPTDNAACSLLYANARPNGIGTLPPNPPGTATVEGLGLDWARLR